MIFFDKNISFCLTDIDNTLFVCKSDNGMAPKPHKFLKNPPFIRQKNSLLFREGSLLLKLIAPQKPIDYLRKYYNSQASREKYASQRLTEIGIKAPKVYNFGYSIAPWSKWDSFLIMRWVEHSQTAASFFSSENDSKRRNKILNIILKDIENMLQHGMIHKDMHLENILIDKNDQIVWVDNDVSSVSEIKKTERFLKKFMANNLFSSLEKRVAMKRLQNFR